MHTIRLLPSRRLHQTFQKPHQQGKEIDGGPPAASAGIKTDSLNSQKESADTSSEVAAFRRLCEQKCADELGARTVAIVADGGRLEIKGSIAMTHLYQNLGD